MLVSYMAQSEPCCPPGRQLSAFCSQSRVFSSSLTSFSFTHFFFHAVFLFSLLLLLYPRSSFTQKLFSLPQQQLLFFTHSRVRSICERQILNLNTHTSTANSPVNRHPLTGMDVSRSSESSSLSSSEPFGQRTASWALSLDNLLADDEGVKAFSVSHCFSTTLFLFLSVQRIKYSLIRNLRFRSFYRESAVEKISPFGSTVKSYDHSPIQRR